MDKTFGRSCFAVSSIKNGRVTAHPIADHDFPDERRAKVGSVAGRLKSSSKVAAEQSRERRDRTQGRRGGGKVGEPSQQPVARLEDTEPQQRERCVPSPRGRAAAKRSVSRGSRDSGDAHDREESRNGPEVARQDVPARPRQGSPDTGVEAIGVRVADRHRAQRIEDRRRCQQDDRHRVTCRVTAARRLTLTKRPV